MENIILFIIILLIPTVAYSLINITYSKYRNEKVESKLSGFDVARKILDENGLKNLYIVEIKSNLNDHYDYNQKVIRLTSDVYYGEDVTACSVAAKVCSYAIQDKENNSFMKFAFSFNSFINFDCYAAYLLFIIGVCLQDFGIVKLSSLLLLIAVVFRFVTLPVEFDAAKISRKNLEKLKILNDKEIEESYSILMVSNFSNIMMILVCVSNLISEIFYNIQKK